MKWQEDGIILHGLNYGEKSMIMSLLTRERGRVSGVIRKGQSIPQIGSLVQASWNARLEHHLGRFQLEITQSLGFDVLGAPFKLAILGSALTLCYRGLAERHPYPELYDALKELLRDLPLCSDEVCVRRYVLFELLLLRQLGFGLDLSCCAATGVRNDLIYISPKSGRSVSREAGQAYKDRLLPLPAFMKNDTAEASLEDLLKALKALGYFLEKHPFIDSGLPIHRHHMQQRLLKSIPKILEDDGA